MSVERVCWNAGDWFARRDISTRGVMAVKFVPSQNAASADVLQFKELLKEPPVVSVVRQDLPAVVMLFAAGATVAVRMKKRKRRLFIRLRLSRHYMSNSTVERELLTAILIRRVS